MFYLLAFTAIAVLTYGIYQRCSRHAEGDADSFARVDDLSNQIVSSAKIVLPNEKQFNRDLYGRLIHSFIM